MLGFIDLAVGDGGKGKENSHPKRDVLIAAKTLAIVIIYAVVPCVSERQPHRRNEGLSEEGTFYYIGSYLGRRIHFLKLSATAVNPKSPIIAAAGVKE